MSMSMYFVILWAIVLDCVVCELDPADDPANIIRPCPDLNLDCIRQYFAINSNCEVAEGPVPDPLYMGDNIVKYSNANITLLLTNVQVTGLGGDIVEFYINIETDNLVLAMKTKTLALATPKGHMKLKRKKKQSIEISDYLVCEYGVATLTAIFPRIYNLDLDELEVSSYVEDGNAPYSAGPKFSRISDPEAKKDYEELNSNIPLSVQMEFSWLEEKYMKAFIQSLICNFGKSL